MGQKPPKTPKSPRPTPQSSNEETENSSPRTLNSTSSSTKKKKTATGTKKSGESDNFSAKKLDKLYDKYKDPEGDDIQPKGVMQFIQDLELTPLDPVVLIMAYHLKAKQMGIFSKEEFVGGFKTLGLDSIEKIKSRIGQFKDELKDDEKLSEIYKFAFNFYKDEKHKKSVEMDLVDSILEILIPNKPHIQQIRKFLKQQKQYKVLNFDQYCSIYDFSNSVGPELTEYEEDAWPVLIDMFVEWKKEGHTGDTENEEPKEQKEDNGKDE